MHPADLVAVKGLQVQVSVILASAIRIMPLSLTWTQGNFVCIYILPILNTGLLPNTMSLHMSKSVQEYRSWYSMYSGDTVDDIPEFTLIKDRLSFGGAVNLNIHHFLNKAAPILKLSWNLFFYWACKLLLWIDLGTVRTTRKNKKFCFCL